MGWEHDLWYLWTELTEIWHFSSFSSYSCNKLQNGKMTSEHDLWCLCTEITKIWDFESFCSYSCKQAVKQSNGLKTRFVILVDWTPGDMRFLKFLLVHVVISRKTVKWAENIDLCYFYTKLTDIWHFWSFSSYNCNNP